ncbi:MAG: phosphatase PAP2 family protein [Solirubrobacterales bacterium]|nr:phosphatase PAP2 family protein [Solirubrobacterales bacterium]
MDRRTRNLLLAALLCAGGVAVLALLFYGSDRFNSLDLRLTMRLMASEGSASEALFHGLADLANPIPLLLALGAIVVIGVGSGRFRELLIALVAFFGANLSTQIMKAVLAHPRLQSALGATHHIEVGYPSGHTTAAFSVAFALWLVVPPRFRGVAAAVGTAYGVVVATGVVVAGWHFLTDVAGAILVVGFWACLALIWSGELSRR